MEKSYKVRILSHFSPGHETSVILYLVLHFSEVWKCGKVWPKRVSQRVQSKICKASLKSAVKQKIILFRPQQQLDPELSLLLVGESQLN